MTLGRFMRWDEIVQDLRHGSRRIARRPRFAAAVVLTMALGVGANTAIFSAVYEILLRPLPLPQPHQLAAVFSFDRTTGKYISSSYPEYDDFQRQSRAFQQLSAYVRLPLNVTLLGGTDRMPVEAVTANYFSMLRLLPAAGRLFDAGDRHAPVAVIGESLWRRAFQGSPDAVGRALTIEGRAFTVVGVAPASYRGTNLNWYDPPEVWIPLESAQLVVPRFRQIGIFEHREMRWLVLIGRLRPGTTPSEAQAELETIAARESAGRVTALAFSATSAKFWPSYRSVVDRSLLVLVIMAALVLLMACANMTGLLLARGLGRRQEMAIRISMGASRSRLVRQLVVENLLLAVPGFVAAIAAAAGLQRALLKFPTALGVALALDLNLDAPALIFCAFLTFVVAALVGLASARRGSQPVLVPALKGGALDQPRSRFVRIQPSLVVIQVAVSTILLVATGLLARSLVAAYSTELGYRADHLLTMSMGMSAADISTDRSDDRRREFVSRVARLPGVAGVAYAARLPFDVQSAVGVSADPSAMRPTLTADYSAAGPGLLTTLGIGIVAGRDFTAADEAGPARAAIVNETLAAILFPTANPVGRAILVRPGAKDAAVLHVVGVSRGVRASAWQPPKPYLYVPLSASPAPPQRLVVRTMLEPHSVEPMIRREWRRLAPREPLFDVAAGEEIVRTSLAPQRLGLALAGSFGLLALGLAGLGIYTIVSSSVERCARETGIRLAVGASPPVVVREVLARVLAPAFLGVFAGIGGCLAISPLLSVMVKGVPARDPAVFAVAGACLVAISTLAALGPALRAGRRDPASALKAV